MRSAQGENVWGHSSVLVGVKVSREAVHDKAEIRGSYVPAPAGTTTCTHTRAQMQRKEREDLEKGSSATLALIKSVVLLCCRPNGDSVASLSATLSF